MRRRTSAQLQRRSPAQLAAQDGGGLSTGAKVAIGGGVLALAAVAFMRRGDIAKTGAGQSVVKAVSTLLDKAQRAAVRVLLPKGAEYLADIAFDVGAKYDVSAYVILGITYAESRFGAALTPPGPAGTGDFIARKVDRCTRRDSKGKCNQTLREFLREHPLPGVKEQAGTFVPTKMGWGWGLYQLDWMSHWPYLQTGEWKDPRKAMEYAVGKIYVPARTRIAKETGLTGMDLLQAAIAAYNAGAGPVIRAIKAGKSPSEVTYDSGYIKKILGAANNFKSAADSAQA